MAGHILFIVYVLEIFYAFIKQILTWGVLSLIQKERGRLLIGNLPLKDPQPSRIVSKHGPRHLSGVLDRQRKTGLSIDATYRQLKFCEK
jgi:hypothetical protein